MTANPPITPVPGTIAPTSLGGAPIEFLTWVTLLTGGTTAALDGQAIAGVPTPRIYKVIVGGFARFYALMAQDGSYTPNGTTIIAPVVTNTKVFVLLDEAAASAALASEVTRATAAEATLANSRAPMQGVQFDGSAGAYITNGPVIGSGDFTFACILDVIDAQVAGAPNIIGGSYGLSVRWQTDATARLEVDDSQATSVIFSNYSFNGLNRRVHLAITRTAGVAYLYVDGVQVDTVACTINFTGALNYLAARSAQNENCYAGYISRPVILNRALTAAQVAALAQAGMVSPSDIGGSNTALQTSWAISVSEAPANGFATGPSGTGWTLNSPSTDHTLIIYGGNSGNLDGGPMHYRAGQRFLVTGTAANWSAVGENRFLLSSWVGNNEESNSGVVTGNGPFSFVLTATASSAAAYFVAWRMSFDCSDLSIIPLGAIVATDPGERGAGYQWHDVSGNNADITLPASGVTWSQPATAVSQTVRGTVSWAGTNEPKSLLAQVALPPNAVIQSLTVTSSAATSGTGATIGTTNTPTRWLNSTALPVGRTVFVGDALENLTCASAAAGDCDIVAVPDSVPYTGQFSLTVTYTLAL